MVKSGVGIDEEVKHAYEKVHTKKLRGARFKFDDNAKNVILDGVIDTSEKEPFERLMEGLTDDQSMFALLDVDFSAGDDDRKQNKMVLITWASDNGPPRQRMVMSATKDAMKSVCGDVSIFVQLNNQEEKCIDEVLTKVAKDEGTSFFGRPVVLCKKTKTYTYAD